MTKKTRNEVLQGSTIRVKAGCGNLYVTLNEDESDLYELFAQIGKRGGCAAAWSEALGRIVTKALQGKLTTEETIKQLRGISCHIPVFGGRHGKILSCPDAIGKALEIYLKKDAPEPIEEKKPLPKEEIPKVNMEKVYKEVEQVKKKFKGGACPECGGQISHEEGCEKCQSCGFTKC